jgi:hypothetical protein
MNVLLAVDYSPCAEAAVDARTDGRASTVCCWAVCPRASSAARDVRLTWSGIRLAQSVRRRRRGRRDRA